MSNFHEAFTKFSTRRNWRVAIICRFKEIQCPVNQHRKKINAVSWFKKNNNEKKKTNSERKSIKP